MPGQLYKPASGCATLSEGAAGVADGGSVTERCRLVDFFLEGERMATIIILVIILYNRLNTSSAKIIHDYVI